MNRFSLLLPAATIAAAALAGSANAASYCVHQPAGNCRPGQIDSGANLAQALTQAAASPVDDHVFIGTGTYTAPAGGFVAGGPGALEITGAGATTILDGNTTPIVDLSGAGLDGVAVHLRPASGSVGVYAAGAARLANLAVTGGGGGANQVVGVQADGGVTLAHSTVTIAGANSIGVGLTPVSHATPTVTDTTIDAPIGIFADGGATGATDQHVISRVTILGADRGVVAHGTKVALDNSVLRGSTAGSVALTAECGIAQGKLVAQHVTAIGSGAGTGLVSTCATPNATSDLLLVNSVVRGYGALSARSVTGGATTGWLVERYSDVGGNGPTTVDVGPGNISETEVVLHTADPGFVSPTDFHLTAGSPLVDVGDPSIPVLASDRDGLPRVIGGGEDIGAYELQTVPAQATGGSGGSGGGGGGGGGGGTTVVEPTAGSDAGSAVTPPPTATPGPSILPSPTGAPAPTPAQLRSMLRRAIATGSRGTHTLAWPVAGRVRFDWRLHGHVVARGTAQRTTAGRSRVAVAVRGRLPRHATVEVTATFTPTHGAPISVRARLER
jgi:hypothetical protein